MVDTNPSDAHAAQSLLSVVTSLDELEAESPARRISFLVRGLELAVSGLCTRHNEIMQTARAHTNCDIIIESALSNLNTAELLLRLVAADQQV